MTSLGSKLVIISCPLKQHTRNFCTCSIIVMTQLAQLQFRSLRIVKLFLMNVLRNRASSWEKAHLTHESRASRVQKTSQFNLLFVGYRPDLWHSKSLRKSTNFNLAAKNVINLEHLFSSLFIYQRLASIRAWSQTFLVLENCTPITPESCQPTSGNCFYDMSHASIMIENTADFTIDIS